MVKLMPEMDAETNVYDSTRGWVAKHIRAYVETDGRRGHRWSGVHTLLLTTRGRKTGKQRRTALIYGRDRNRYLVVASNGGAAKDPQWYLNLVEDPRVDVQVGAEKFSALAHTATPEEKPEPWQRMASIWPEYETYQQPTSREIPVVIIEPLGNGWGT